MAKVCCLFLCLLFLQYSNGLNVCGWEDVPKANLRDYRSVENVYTAAIKWSVTPYARGYFMKPLDPLELGDVTFRVADEEFTLSNVKVTGLYDSTLDVSKPNTIPSTSVLNRYTHNVVVEAGNSVRTMLRTGEKFANRSRAKVEISDLATDHQSQLAKVPRCDGKNYILMTYKGLEPRSGVTKIKYGLTSQMKNVDIGDFGEKLAETIGVLCTQAILDNADRFHSIVPYEDLVVG